MTILGVILYRGLDPAGKQLSGFFTGSAVFRDIIDANEVDLRLLLENLLVALK